jgi:hypothetical protein
VTTQPNKRNLLTTTVEPTSPRPQRGTTAIILIKSVHTLIFTGMGSCVLCILYSGLTGRTSRLTKASIGAVLVESLIFFGNGQRCPLTDLAEGLGSEHGSVGDIFLPDWFARRIPVISSTLVVIGLVGMAFHRFSDARHQ